MIDEITIEADVSEVDSDIGQFGMTPLWLFESGASIEAITLFTLLSAKWADREHQSCYPSRKTISALLGRKETSISRYVKDLKRVGALKVIHRWDSSGKPTSNLYRLLYGRPPVDTIATWGVSAERTDIPPYSGHKPESSEPESTITISSSTPSEQTSKERIELDSSIPNDAAGAPPSVLDDSPETTKKSGPDDSPSEEVVRLCTLLADLIQQNGNTRPNPNQKAWWRECRMLLTKDGPEGTGWTPVQVETIIKWAQNDSFWRPNIQSVPKLRKQFNTLRESRNRELEQRNGGGGKPDTMAGLREAARLMDEAAAANE